jgi:hypothetical protein
MFLSGFEIRIMQSLAPVKVTIAELRIRDIGAALKTKNL